MKKFLSSNGFALAFTWFAATCATGFATGKQFLVYYGSHGWLGIVMPILTWVILALVFYYVTEYCRLNRCSNYKDFAISFYVKDSRIGWAFVIYWDLFMLTSSLIGFGGILSVGATSLEYIFGLNYWAGLLLTTGLIIVGSIFGAKIMLKINSVLSYLLVITVFVVTFVVLFSGKGHLGDVVGKAMVNPDSSYAKIVWDAIVYAGLMVSVTGTFAAASGTLSDRGDTKVATLFGAVLNCFMLIFYGLVTLSFYPEVNGEALPVMWVLEKLGSGYTWLTYIYQAVLYLAILTSGISLLFSLNARFSHYGSKVLANDHVRRLVWSAVFLGIGLAISTMGWSAIVTKGYSFMSKLALPIGVVLVAVLGRWRIKQTEAKMYAAGLDPQIDVLPEA